MRLRAFVPALVTAVAASWTGAAGAVELDTDGLGQALIYPYYTARSPGPGRSFQTLVSIVNHTNDAKALRVRFRDGERSQGVLEFNLYLGPRDMWSGAVIPSDAGAANPGAGADPIALLLSNDSSCADPPAPAAGRVFKTESLPGDSSASVGRARTLEGHVEVIEMATLTGASATAVTHTGASGPPPNCALVNGGGTLEIGPPTGGISGTLTLIDVLAGADFTVNADALAALSTQPFHRPPTDPYPGFGATEITPASVVRAGSKIYRAAWGTGNGALAVWAILSRREGLGEFILDSATLSRTDMVVTFPLRSLEAAGSPVGFTLDYRNREGRGQSAIPCDGPFAPICGAQWDHAANVITFDGNMSHTQDDVGILASTGGALVSTNGGAFNQPLTTRRTTRIPLGDVPVSNGSFAWRTGMGFNTLTSQPTSQVIDVATGAVTTGSQVYSGWPVVGFTLRTFRNGTVPCGTATCQGNYGGSFPLKFRRDIIAP